MLSLIYVSIGLLLACMPIILYVAQIAPDFGNSVPSSLPTSPILISSPSPPSSPVSPTTKVISPSLLKKSIKSTVSLKRTKDSTPSSLAHQKNLVSDSVPSQVNESNKTSTSINIRTPQSSSSVSTSNNKSTSLTNPSSNTKRKVYKLPMTQEQKNLINTGQAPLPVGEAKEFDNKIHGLCGNKACKLAVETWRSSLDDVQLVSASDFKAAVKICETCSGPKKITTILKSLSQFQPIDSVDTKQRPVKLYEICIVNAKQ